MKKKVKKVHAKKKHQVKDNKKLFLGFGLLVILFSTYVSLKLTLGKSVLGAQTSQAAQAIQAANIQLSLLNAKYATAPKEEKTQLLSEMVTQSEQRKYGVISVIQHDPASAIKLAMSKEDRAKFSGEPAVQANIEQTISKTGVIRGYHVDDFVHNKESGELYLLNSDTNNFQLYFPKDPGEQVVNAKTSISGVVLGGYMAVNNFKTFSAVKASTSDPNSAIGNKKVLVALVNFTDDQSQQVTPDQIRRQFFGPTGGAYDFSVKNYMYETSYHKLVLSGDVSQWVTIKDYSACTGSKIDPMCGKDSSTAVCSYFTWIDDANKALAKQHISTSNYAYIVYAINNRSCLVQYGQGQFGQFGGVEIPYTNASEDTKSPALIINGFFPDSLFKSNSWFTHVAVHELGHKLGIGLEHASAYICSKNGENTPISEEENCKLDDYGDPFDEMDGGGDGIKQYSNYHKQQLGWIPNSSIYTVTHTGQYSLMPIEQNKGILGLRIKENEFLQEAWGLANPDIYYYLEYRQPLDTFDSNSSKEIQNFFSGITVRLATIQGEQFVDQTLINVQAPKDIYQAVLTQGQSYYDPFNHIKIVADQIVPKSTTATGVAVVDVIFGNSTDTLPTPAQQTQCSQHGDTCTSSSKGCTGNTHEASYTCNTASRDQVCCAPTKTYGKCGTDGNGICKNDYSITSTTTVVYSAVVPSTECARKATAQGAARNTQVYCCLSDYAIRAGYHYYGTCNGGNNICTDDSRCGGRISSEASAGAQCTINAVKANAPGGEKVYCIIPKPTPTKKPTPTPTPNRCTNCR